MTDSKSRNPNSGDSRPTGPISAESDPEAATLSEVTVGQWLLERPDFLIEHPDLLQALSIRHESGTSSLIERQVQVLREQNQRLNRQLRHLSGVAGENEQRLQRLHRLSIDLLGAASLLSMVERLVDGLRDDFRADAVCLMLTNCPTELQALEAVSQMPTERPAWLEKLLGSGEPHCGRLTRAKRDQLFGESGGALASAALLPLDPNSLLAIGSESADRFHSDMGTLFLQLLRETLQSKLQQSSSAGGQKRVNA
ncbi:MAG: DUF484 family protein [Wenzhouxiangellaceae bacterium]|nr:DUF484 family protein [Wenzhouxiangellaceae bacterium]